jgi:hypothetical protein
MSTNNMIDYYPVYKEIGVEPVMLNAGQLLDKALKSGFNTFQTAILLCKNSMEGFVYLSFDKTPDFMHNNGTTILNDYKPEFLLHSFYSKIDEYRPGLLTQIETLLRERHYDFFELNPEKLLFIILDNHLVRFPVAIFASIDLCIFDGYALNPNTTYQSFRLVQLGERFACEFDLIERVDRMYNLTYKSLGEQIKLKVEILEFYKRKYLLACDSAVRNEEELDQLLFQNLVHTKLNGTSENMFKLNYAKRFNPSETLLPVHQKLKSKSKTIYRSISKNCAEIHSDAAENSISEELTAIFMKASTIYNMPVSGIAETFLVYVQLMLLFSKVTVFRKIKGLPVAEGFHLKSDSEELVLSKTELRNLERDLDEILIASRFASFTDYKMKFVFDEELVELHRNHLAQEIKYIDKQISQYKLDIQSIMQAKSQTDNE